MRIGRSRARCGSDDHRAACRIPARGVHSEIGCARREGCESQRVGAGHRVAVGTARAARPVASRRADHRLASDGRPLDAHHRRLRHRGRVGGAIRSRRQRGVPARAGARGAKGRALRPSPAGRRARPPDRRQSRLGRRSIRAARLLRLDAIRGSHGVPGWTYGPRGSTRRRR